MPPTLQGAVEPMQIDVDPQEDPQNAPDVNYVVENPTLKPAVFLIAHVRWLLAQLGTPTPPPQEGPVCWVCCRSG